MSGPTIVRVSAMNGYPDCNRRGATRLFWHEIKAAGFELRRLGRGIGAVVGTAVHRGAEIALGEKARAGSLPPVSVALDAATELLREQLRDQVEFDGPRGVTHTPREAERQTVAMSLTYHLDVAPGIEPIIVEERLEAAIGDGLVLSGQPDVVAREPQAIRDLKTGTRGPGTFAAQIGGYSLLARSNGLSIEHGRIDYVRRVSVTKPQPATVTRAIPVDAAETAASSILKHIAADIRTFRHGDPERRIFPGDPWAFQANPASILCSAKYCAAFGTEFCHEGDANK